MKKTTIAILVVFSIFIFQGCEDSNPQPSGEPKTIALTETSIKLIENSNDFGVSLFKNTALAEHDNLMLSPLSAGIALTMALNGADQETYSQIKKMLGYDENMTLEDINSSYNELVPQLLNADDLINISIANAVFYSETFYFHESFFNTMGEEFNATVEGHNFSLPATVDVINNWASDNTNGKIEQVIDGIDPLTVMFLMNALYFKGDWTYQFDESETTSLPFTLESGESINVETMQGLVGSIQYHGDNYKSIELPYGRKNYSMVLIVPNNSINDFYNDFTPQLWDEITTAMNEQTEWAETQIFLPKFSFEYEKVLNDILIEMGMEDAFDDNIADFSNISPLHIWIDFVKQNTFIDVNEEGTEAAAVTTIGFETESAGPPRFMIDKPFIFAIRERTTNTLMFMGSVYDPSES